MCLVNVDLNEIVILNSSFSEMDTVVSDCKGRNFLFIS